MMPDPIILALGSAMVILIIGKWRPLVETTSDCMDGNVERLIREEQAELNSWEARIILARMEKERVA